MCETAIDVLNGVVEYCTRRSFFLLNDAHFVPETYIPSIVHTTIARNDTYTIFSVQLEDWDRISLKLNKMRTRSQFLYESINHTTSQIDEALSIPKTEMLRQDLPQDGVQSGTACDVRSSSTLFTSVT